MKTSAKGLQLIEKHEGCQLRAYVCPAGKVTIGIGHTRTAKYGQVITKEQAYDLLKSDLAIAEAEVNRHNLQLNQNQFDALVSLVFNIGSGAFSKSTLLLKIKGHSPMHEIRKEFGRWIYGGGQILPGLMQRRYDESILYFTL